MQISMKMRSANQPQANLQVARGDKMDVQGSTGWMLPE